MSITSFVDDLSSAVFGRFSLAGQELVVFGVFLISCTLWRRLRRSRVHKRKGKASKLIAFDDSGKSSASLRKGLPVGEYRLSEDAGAHASAKDTKPVDVQPSSSEVIECEAMATRILRHLDHLEFTRALALFRGRERCGCHQQFGENFYVTFVESAARVGKLDVIEYLLGCMRRDGLVPSAASWKRLLRAFSSRKFFSSCVLVHELFQDVLPTNKVVWSCLTNAALQVGDVQRMPHMLGEYSKADLVIDDHVLFFRAYLALVDADSAEGLFRRLGGNASPLMLNLLLLTCVGAKQPERCLQLLTEAHTLEEESGVQLVDSASYNTIMKGLAQIGALASCFGCLKAMVSRSLQPDDVTYTTLLGACIEGNNADAIDKAVKLLLKGKHRPDAATYALFLKWLAKAGRMAKALELYESMRREADILLDVITYSVLIKALVDQQELEHALWLAEDMKSAGRLLDDIIITHLIEGCRQEGKVALGEHIFNESVASGVQPSEYTLITLLKLYGNSGANQKALDLVAGWEAAHGVKPTVIHYTCLMSGCFRRKCYDMAWAAYELMKAHGVKPDGTTIATLLPSMVAAQGWDRTLVLAREALSSTRPGRKIPGDALNSALAQMWAIDAGKAAELQEIMREAGVSVAATRPSTGCQLQRHSSLRRRGVSAANTVRSY